MVYKVALWTSVGATGFRGYFLNSRVNNHYIYIGGWGVESFSEPQPGIALLEVRSVQTGSAVPNSVGRRTLAGAKVAILAPLDYGEK